MECKSLKVDKEKCIHCGKCLRDCVSMSLEFDENNIPQWADGGEDRCVKCQHCFSICPVGAISIMERKPYEAGEVNYGDDKALLGLIKSRKSIRQYKTENLDEERMSKLKAMLKWSPTGCNFHKLHFSFIDNIDVMNDFRKIVNKRFIKALKFEPMSPITNKFGKYKEAFLKGKDIIYRGAPHMVVVSVPINAPCANVDPIIALSYFELYAQSLGVGTLWCGFGAMVFKFFPDLCEYIKVPEGYKVSYVMLFGPKDVEYTRTTIPQEFSMNVVKIPKDRKTSILASIKHFIVNFLR